MIITLKDGSTKEYDQAMSVLDIAKDISEGLARVACAGEVDGELVDLRTVVDKDCNLNILTFESEGGAWAFHHTTSHIMAQAIKRLYPDVKLAIGPSVADGFYYDVDSETPLTAEDLVKIEAEMKKIVKEALPITRFTKSREEAIAYFKEKEEPYKVELIEDLPEDAEISFYQQGEFVDLCAGPHLMSTKPVKAFKLTSLAGAYWRGSEKNKMLTRIYGTSFTKKADLEEYLNRMEEAKKRDHRKLGKELGLFMMREEGPGFPFFLPKGMVLKNTLLDYWREIHRKNGYVEISTPIMLSRHLWETSGHWDHYKENMYTTVIDDTDFAIKPMNCPGGILVYQSEPRSYRDLPLRMGELGLVHRHEKSGQLHGLMRVRCFTQDDAHIFMMPEQIRDEIKGVARLIDEVYQLFGFKYHVELSTRPEDSMGSDEDWEMATEALRGALDDLGLPYVVNEGDGAFYGPKIDFHLEDSIGRTWQCGTIQLDFQLPLRFNCEYIGADGEKHRPIMIHRVAFGSIERFIGILIEHFAGAFPTWLSPVQVKVLPISDKYMEYGEKVKAALEAANIRTEIDTRAEKIGYKIREARLQKIPYMLVVGAKEEEENTVSVRSRFAGDEGAKSLDDFIAAITEEIKNRENRKVEVEEQK
ncbi:threonine--tRNA ligase [Faecalicatena fissicatena]|uniref:Threonine--tRNA ligase n=1 Tax=Faecalicatena fissicatena TaxID=290055 RepID=A0ABX2GY93_9FIRM|nr:threonine--tRNA ligase [Faecalicatena fissicatena]MCB5866916.1 threonine--tRNA ligase [Faecalicatena fissicatena]NSD76254.1 threonine--tRNA ligase [Faecalicatena fissicatena]NSD82849.1 threonine--tRNA ligase [Faecalicatena fissicatena]NSE55438.1 threonine--tRNA ligase [Faecalicatena fissicatena]NSE64196.1 threonine--tRNA ligase [Faecalicatena fissicatena]